MATTMKLIAKQTLGADTATVTFSSIPGNMTDLALVCSARTSRASAVDDYIKIQFNSSSANLSGRYLVGNAGSSSAASATDTAIYVVCCGSTATANTFGNGIFYIPNYAGSTNKSVSIEGTMENNSATSIIYAAAGLWSNTAAITQIDITSYYSANIKADSSFFLYGITRA